MAAVNYREVLKERRENLRKLYARYRECGSRMRQKRLVDWSSKTHKYYTQEMWSAPGKIGNDHQVFEVAGEHHSAGNVADGT